VEEVMRALDDLVRAGKVLYVGISDTPAWVAAQANTLAGLRGWSPFVGLQIEYSLIERTPERELLPMARAFGLGITPWGVVAGGVLTGKYQADPKAPRDALRAKLNVGSQRTSARALRIAAEVQAVAAELGRTPAQVALAWARRQGPQLIPIVGARTAAQLRDNLACLEVALEPAHLERLDAVSRIELGFPHDFLSIPRIVEQRFGGTQDRIDFRGE
jgi:aryl-alcohol dehydrogenase-like predicted oxidoreductase